MKLLVSTITTLVLLTSCGGENKSSEPAGSTVTGNEFQTAISSCSNGRTSSLSEIEGHLYSRVSELGQIYPGQSKSVVETYTMNTYQNFGQNITCVVQKVREMTVVQTDGRRVYSLVNERIEPSDSKPECQQIRSTRQFIHLDRRDVLDIRSRISFNLRNANVKVATDNNGMNNFCIQDSSNSANQFVLSLNGPLWNTDSVLKESFFVYGSYNNQDRTIQTTRLNDRNLGYINIYNYPIIED